ncbi:hypothetical protein MAE02_35090 [Microvirga aerophila]|uniref:Uncharacterized protein n=1 Tax=Microvirga aerophila TaxID=670291 RepID=A0A512BV22_9HYPH|nr:hypothetical protein MAE02_35090 [Microvirga aerophila]
MNIQWSDVKDTWCVFVFRIIALIAPHRPFTGVASQRKTPRVTPRRFELDRNKLGLKCPRRHHVLVGAYLRELVRAAALFMRIVPNLIDTVAMADGESRIGMGTRCVGHSPATVK